MNSESSDRAVRSFVGKAQWDCVKISSPYRGSAQEHVNETARPAASSVSRNKSSGVGEAGVSHDITTPMCYFNSCSAGSFS
jgi:hypothetical protein